MHPGESFQPVIGQSLPGQRVVEVLVPPLDLQEVDGIKSIPCSVRPPPTGGGVKSVKHPELYFLNRTETINSLYLGIFSTN